MAFPAPNTGRDGRLKELVQLNPDLKQWIATTYREQQQAVMQEGKTDAHDVNREAAARVAFLLRSEMGRRTN